MRKSLSTISIFLTIFLSAQSFIVFGETQSNLGSYFLFGEYNDEEILWRCIEEDDEKLLLFSDKVLCDKPFDAAGTVESGSHTRDDSRSKKGSNFWEDSTIRAWLGSDKVNNEIIYPCGNPPSNDEENGFLYNFTESEKNLIQTVSQKSILDTPDYDAIENDMKSGTEKHPNNGNISEALDKYGEAYSHNVMDTVFLLDVKQIHSAYKLDYHNNVDQQYWLRTPRTTSTYHRYVRMIVPTNTDTTCISNDDAQQPRGIRPALYIPKNGIIKIGSGTKDDPYKIASINVSSNSVTATVNIPKYSGEGYVIATINSEPNKIGEITMANITFNSEKRIDKEIKFENVTPKPGDILNIFIWDTNMKPVTEKFTYTFN